jgi:hypothetical protein
MERPIRLRDLPGIAEIELKCKSRSYFDDRHKADTLAHINEVSESLFSLPYWLTDYYDYDWSEADDPPMHAQWDTILANAERDFDEAREFWEALGWDLSDEKGRELNCAHWFARQIIILESSWIDDVVLTPDGSGRFIVQDNEPLDEDALAERLYREAEAFLLRQNRRAA